MATLSPHHLLVIAAAYAVLACQRPLEGRPCPCDDGWTCESSVCVRNHKRSEARASDGQSERCGVTEPFVRIEDITQLNSPAQESTPRLSSDQHTVYYSYRTPVGAIRLIYTASRYDMDTPFNVPSGLLVGGSGPTLAKDGTLYYAFDDGSSSSSYPDVFVVTPPYTLERASAVSQVNSDGWDYLPYISADGSELYLTRRAQTSSDGAAQPDDLYVAPVLDGAIAQPQPIDALNTPEWSERSPVLSADGLRLYFASNRPGGVGDMDIYVASRVEPGASFKSVEAVQELNTSHVDAPGWISPDDCTLYFTSDRPGGLGDLDIWRASRR